MWISQGDDDVECLVVEVWVNEFPIRIVNGYGPKQVTLWKENKSFGTLLIEKLIMQ